MLMESQESLPSHLCDVQEQKQRLRDLPGRGNLQSAALWTLEFGVVVDALELVGTKVAAIDPENGLWWLISVFCLRARLETRVV